MPLSDTNIRDLVDQSLESRRLPRVRTFSYPAPVLELTARYPGRKEIVKLASGLRLPERLSDAGLRYYNLAVNMNFVQGRRAQYVIAACLYSACRMAKTSHMLIDFSDLLEVSPPPFSYSIEAY